MYAIIKSFWLNRYLSIFCLHSFIHSFLHTIQTNGSIQTEWENIASTFAMEFFRVHVKLTQTAYDSFDKISGNTQSIGI